MVANGTLGGLMLNGDLLAYSSMAISLFSGLFLVAIHNGRRTVFAAFCFPVGALRLLRLTGRVCDRAGNSVRCGLPNVTSLPPLANDTSVPRQFREARP